MTKQGSKAEGETWWKEFTGNQWVIAKPSKGLYPKHFPIVVARCTTEDDTNSILDNHNDAALLREKLARWEEVMTDISVVNGTLNEENKDDLAKQLQAVIAQTIQEQLDPVVSEQTVLLRVAVEAAEASTDWIKEHAECWCNPATRLVCTPCGLVKQNEASLATIYASAPGLREAQQ